ncbi:hypothetical protein QTP88_009582 [Uroleucon formosanum]
MAEFKTLKLEMSIINKALSDSLTLKFNELKSKFQKGLNKYPNLKPLLQENFEHGRCLPNLIIYGVPESSSPDTSVRIKHDKLTISESLSSLENAVPEKFKIIRLGRSRAEFIRPVKMICESKDSAFNLFSAYNSAKLSGKPFPKGFRMSRDRTSLQRKLLCSCYEDLERRVKSESSLNSNPADYWKFVKNKRSFSAIPKEVSYRETTSTNEREVANLFSKYISSVFSDNQLNLDTSSLGIKSFDLPNNINITVENVYKHLTDLHGNWSIGPDGLSGEYIYQLKNIIAFPLWTLFKRSLEEGIFSSILKFSSITPVHKSGELSNVSRAFSISQLS